MGSRSGLGPSALLPTLFQQVLHFLDSPMYCHNTSQGSKHLSWLSHHKNSILMGFRTELWTLEIFKSNLSNIRASEAQHRWLRGEARPTVMRCHLGKSILEVLALTSDDYYAPFFFEDNKETQRNETHYSLLKPLTTGPWNWMEALNGVKALQYLEEPDEEQNNA